MSHISLFDLFSIGIGPSSSHTVGPMRAAKTFVLQLVADGLLEQISRVRIELYGSLALTGVGHGTIAATLLGLEDYGPATIDPAIVTPRSQAILTQHSLTLAGKKTLAFTPEDDLALFKKNTLPHHTNGMRFLAYAGESIVANTVFYSIGGGFIVDEAHWGIEPKTTSTVTYPFDTAQELLALCESHDLTIAELMRRNEHDLALQPDVDKALLKIADAMAACIKRGCGTDGILPGGLNVRRRAPALHAKLQKQNNPSQDIMTWLNLYAMAVNEENAAGGRIVTAPTNGAAGIIPAVLEHYKTYYENVTETKIADFLLTAGAIAILYKKGASISGAEVGCQGEVGAACSMAAGALAAVLGGSVLQIENAAEIGMEHNLGLTCDPIGGLVQIPCIERNAIGAVQAVNAAQLALQEDGEHHVSLDHVIQTMKRTGRDMMTIYKETSLGGLAVNIPEC